MKASRLPTKEEFDQMLAWLDPDPSKSGQRYEDIRRRLINFFLNRQYSEAEDLADETINRVAQKPQDLRDGYEGEPMPYFHAVARNVAKEYARQLNRRIQIIPHISAEEREPYLQCLATCLLELSKESRELVLTYFQKEKREKIETHRTMEDHLGLKPGALRARIFRVKAKLQPCIEECVRIRQRSNDNNVQSIYMQDLAVRGKELNERSE